MELPSNCNSTSLSCSVTPSCLTQAVGKITRQLLPFGPAVPPALLIRMFALRSSMVQPPLQLLYILDTNSASLLTQKSHKKNRADRLNYGYITHHNSASLPCFYRNESHKIPHEYYISLSISIREPKQDMGQQPRQPRISLSISIREPKQPCATGKMRSGISLSISIREPKRRRQDGGFAAEYQFINIHQRTKTRCAIYRAGCSYQFINIHQRTKTG